VAPRLREAAGRLSVVGLRRVVLGATQGSGRCAPSGGPRL